MAVTGPELARLERVSVDSAGRHVSLGAVICPNGTVAYTTDVRLAAAMAMEAWDQWKATLRRAA